MVSAHSPASVTALSVFLLASQIAVAPPEFKIVGEPLMKYGRFAGHAYVTVGKTQLPAAQDEIARAAVSACDLDDDIDSSAAMHKAAEGIWPAFISTWVGLSDSNLKLHVTSEIDVFLSDDHSVLAKAFPHEPHIYSWIEIDDRLIDPSLSRRVTCSLSQIGKFSSLQKFIEGYYGPRLTAQEISDVRLPFSPGLRSTRRWKLAPLPGRAWAEGGDVSVILTGDKTDSSAHLVYSFEYAGMAVR